MGQDHKSEKVRRRGHQWCPGVSRSTLSGHRLLAVADYPRDLRAPSTSVSRVPHSGPQGSSLWRKCSAVSGALDARATL